MNDVTLRTAADRLAFCDEYFDAVGAHTVSHSNDYREYELTRDVDKEMTDRPYYWMWAETTNQEVPPSILRLAFTEDALKQVNERLRIDALAKAEAQGMNDIQRMYFRPPTAEFVTLGSFRLDKLYSSLDTRGRFACVMPKSATAAMHLVPWLMVNVLVSYRCDLTLQRMMSIGLCMKNGQIIDRFFEMIRRIEMQPMTPIPPSVAREIHVDAGLRSVRAYLEKRLMNNAHNWAFEAQERLEQELNQLRTYYRSILPDVPESEHALVDAEQTRKEQELTERMQPRINIHCKQVAIVGLIERAEG